MQVGMTKDQPSAAVHPGALATGTLLQYNTIAYEVGNVFVNELKIQKKKSFYYFNAIFRTDLQNITVTYKRSCHNYRLFCAKGLLSV